MNLFFGFLLLTFLIVSTECRGVYQSDDRLDFDSILDKISEKLNENKEEYPDGYELGRKSTKQAVFPYNNANIGHHIDKSTKKETTSVVTAIKPVTKKQPIINQKDHDNSNSWKVFFILSILGCSIIVVHILIKTEFHYLPESIAVVFMGAIIGFIFKFISHWNIADWTHEETFSPTIFFLVLLPPIIFESGYSMHKGNFFENIGSICVFAIFGTAISAIVMGAGIYSLGRLSLTYELTAKEAFAFGSLVSAVDPVATLAIFNALEIDPVLYMLVFGESILNDAVAIVLTNTIIELADTTHGIIWVGSYIVGRFFLMFFASAMIGSLFGLLSALIFKHIDLRRTPSLETAFMIIFMYSPYAFAEALHLSGIMAILFAGIVMSHYTHFNLSSVTRITVQQIFRTLSFVAETCVFAYLGLAIFSFRHSFKPSLVIFSIILCLLSRACNIFPLSTILNLYREHKITKKMQFIMWFSGLRGAIAFALCLNLEKLETEARHVLITTTLILVLFTTMFLGGGTMPMMKFLNRNSDRVKNKDKEMFVFFSKVKEVGESVQMNTRHGQGPESDKFVGDDSDIRFVRDRVRLRGFARVDELVLKPFFIRKFTDEELQEGQIQMKNLTKQWYDEVKKEEKALVNDEGLEADTTSFGEFTNKMKKVSGSKVKKSDNKTYQKLNSTTISSMLDSTDGESNSENDQVIIDKSRFDLTTNL